MNAFAFVGKILRVPAQGVALVFLFSCWPTGATAAPSVREDIRTFSQDPAKVAQLRAAVAALKELDTKEPDNLKRWLYLAAIHMINSADPVWTGASPTNRTFFNQCHSREELFFLWHRAYVAAVERVMQEKIGDPNFRLPYWDWYSDPALPAIFREEFLDPAKKSPNPLYVKDRNPAANNGQPVWSPFQLTDFRLNSFGAFQESLNFGEHGSIHMAVGNSRNMANPQTAARDPIFYLHHANIDRLLVAWRKVDPAKHHAPASFPAWSDALYRFPGTDQPTWKPTIQDLDLDADSALGYSYQSSNITDQKPPPLPPRPAVVSTGKNVESKMLGNGLQSLGARRQLAIGSGVTIQLPLASEGVDRLKVMTESAALAPAAPADAEIVIEQPQLDAPPPPGVLSYRVFINLPEKPTSESFFDHYVGTISLFNLKSKDDEHAAHSPASLRFPLLKLLARQAGKKGFPRNISISLVPELAPWASSPDRTVITVEEIRLQVSENPPQ